VVHHLGDVGHHLGIAVVQGDQFVVALEVAKTVAAPVKPRRRRVIGAVVQRFAVAGEVGAHMVENTVEKHPQPTPVGLAHQIIEIGLITQARIDREVVRRVVPVGAGLEDRPQRQPGCAEFDGVIQPADDPAQSVRVGRRVGLGGKSADEPQRIHLPPDGVANPVDAHQADFPGRNFLAYNAFISSCNVETGPSTTRPGATV
jgi:hypothetical protein